MTYDEPTIPGTRRLKKELTEFQKSNFSAIKDLKIDETNIYIWTGLILPENPPFNEGAFKVEILFPPEYPFKPPKILLKTKIYHPNFDEKGQVCLGILSPENWKPSTSVEQILQAYVALVNDPDPVDALRSDLGTELATDRDRFFKNALQYTRKFSEKRI